MSPLAVGLLVCAVLLTGAAAVVGWRLLADVVGHGGAAVLVALGSALVVGGPWLLSVAALSARTARAVRGAPRGGRLLAVATAGLPGGRGEWGAAMRAELASIDDPRERRRFARGCTWAALRQGTGRVPVALVLGVALAFALATVAVSRLVFAGHGPGILGYVAVGFPQVVLLAAAFLPAWSTRSFRVGLETGALALVAALLGYLAVAMPESAYWYHQAGVYLLDGDPPKTPDPNPALDPLLPLFLVAPLLLWPPCAVIGAELGARLSWRRAHGHAAVPAVTA